MITLKEMVMIFVFTTSWTVRAVMTVTTMDDMTNGKNTVTPLHKEDGMAVILIADDSVVLPINITGERPWRGRNDMFLDARLIFNLEQDISFGTNGFSRGVILS